MDRKKIDSFWHKRSKIKHPRISTHFKSDDCHLFDLKLINKYIKPSVTILDLACGPCYYANRLISKVKHIKAVDKFANFFSYCKKNPNLTTVQSDILSYNDKKQYDLVLLLGIMHFFDEKERELVYRKCQNFLKQKGVLIIRHQCGVSDDIVIDQYSEEIKDHYRAKYLYLNKEIKMLEKYYRVELVDIFPKRLNRWSNSHYYAFVCRAKKSV